MHTHTLTYIHIHYEPDIMYGSRCRHAYDSVHPGYMHLTSSSPSWPVARGESVSFRERDALMYAHLNGTVPCASGGAMYAVEWL